MMKREEFSAFAGPSERIDVVIVPYHEPRDKQCTKEDEEKVKAIATHERTRGRETDSIFSGLDSARIAFMLRW